MSKYIEFHEQRRREREADLPRRLRELTPEAASRWTGVLNRAEPLARAETPNRPCDYGPWTAALEKVAGKDIEWPAQALMKFARDVSAPGWPQAHAHVVDFALRFLDADVMLFNSGYVKRHMLIRVRQAKLTEAQAERARRILERAVVDGAGLEEFREFCRLAARVWTEAFGVRLAALSQGAMLTLDHIDAGEWAGTVARFDEATLRKLMRTDWSCRAVWAFPATFEPRLTKTVDLPPINRVKVNAWRMLRRAKTIRRSRGEAA